MVSMLYTYTYIYLLLYTTRFRYVTARAVPGLANIIIGMMVLPSSLRSLQMFDFDLSRYLSK